MSIKIKNKKDKTYIILGVPKSATSFISKLLEESGVKMHNDKNERCKDLYEDTAFIKLNEKILRSSGEYGLKRPKMVINKNFGKQIKELVDKRKNKMWGWKDPRSSLTIKNYFPYLSGDIYMICCFRKPNKITESTQRWNIRDSKGLTKEKIDCYNESIIEAIKEFCELK